MNIAKIVREAREQTPLIVTLVNHIQKGTGKVFV